MTSHASKRIGVSMTINALAHYVKQSGIDDRLESGIPCCQIPHIRNCEDDIDASLVCFEAGFLDRCRSGIDGDNAISLRRQVDCVFSRAASRIQNLAANLASVHKITDERSGAVNIPRRAWPTRVNRVECSGSISNRFICICHIYDISIYYASIESLMRHSKRGAAIQRIDRAMVRIRRSQTKRTIGRLMERELVERFSVAQSVVADALDDLSAIDGEKPSVGMLAEYLGVDPSRASRLVADAIREGYVKRVASQSDGRRAGLELTGAGRKLLGTASRFRKRIFSKVMAGWSDHDCDEFARLLTKFTESP